MSRIFRKFGMVSISAVASNVILPAVANAVNTTIIDIADIEDDYNTDQKIRKKVGSFNGKEIYGFHTKSSDDSDETITIFFRIFRAKVGNENGEIVKTNCIHFFNDENKITNATHVGQVGSPVALYSVDHERFDNPNNVIDEVFKGFKDPEKIVEVILRHEEGHNNSGPDLFENRMYSFSSSKY